MKVVWNWHEAPKVDDWYICARWFIINHTKAVSIEQNINNILPYKLRIYTSIAPVYFHKDFDTIEEAKAYADDRIKCLGYKTMPDYMKTLL